MSFKEILETLPTIDHLTGLNVMDGETIIHNIPAIPNPGKHPNIDLLFKVINENLNLTLIPLC